MASPSGLILALAAGALANLGGGALIVQLHESAAAERALLPLEFDHTLHVATSCATCHHDYVDDTPSGGACLSCHKKTREIASRIEPMFHGLCQDCHVETAHAGEATGPVRLCSGCHAPETARFARTRPLETDPQELGP